MYHDCIVFTFTRLLINYFCNVCFLSNKYILLLLKCIFCQNYDVSQTGSDGGEENDDLELAARMIDLQKRRCHNINLVSPTHVVAPILRALVIAKERGLDLPIVYNTGGYYIDIRSFVTMFIVHDMFCCDTKPKKDGSYLPSCNVFGGIWRRFGGGAAYRLGCNS